MLKRKDNKKCIAYVRVSTAEQAQRNLSIPAQIEQIENYCMNNFLSIEKVFKEHHSAFKGRRPVFNDMLKYLEKNKDIGFLIVFKWDRCARNNSDFLKLDDLSQKLGFEIISVTEPNLNNYLGRYMIRDMQNRAILYSEELSFRVKLGLRKKLQNGGYNGGRTPYGYDKIDGKFIPNDTGKVVKYIFEMYSSGQYGFKELRNKVMENFKLKTFGNKTIEHILNNGMYYGYRVKTRHLKNEEYLLWGADGPGEFRESYKMNCIIPIIDKDLFDQCQIIRDQHNRHLKIPKGIERFPKIFTCSCGRKLTRDDKKGIRYFKCPKQISGVFPEKCLAPYYKVSIVEEDLFEIIKKTIHTKKERKDFITMVEAEMKLNEEERSLKRLEFRKEIDSLNSKLSEITDSYINNYLPKTVFENVANEINSKILAINNQLKGLDDYKNFLIAGDKLIKFFKILDIYEENMFSSEKKEKSSNTFSIIFLMLSNIIIHNSKVQSYELNQPFNLLQNNEFCLNQREPDLN